MKIDNRLVDAKSEAENTENFNRIMSFLDNVNVTQPDWNQNDETAPDYVKNRPFYTGDPVETEIMPATTVTFAGGGGIMYAELPVNFNAVEGQTYKISWDSTDYVCTCTVVDGNQYLGNLGLFGDGDNTGEPFIFSIGSSSWIAGSKESATEHVIAIIGYVSQIVKIDKKYIPYHSKFVVDAMHLPTDDKAWDELKTALNDAYNSVSDIFLLVDGNGRTLKLTNRVFDSFLFLGELIDNIMYIYELSFLYPSGGELKKYSLTTTEVL